jgi:hypothetical protein
MRVLTASVAVVLLCSAPLDLTVAQRGLVPPRVTVRSLEPLPWSGGAQRFRAVVLVDNMNTEPLRLKGLDFKLRLAGQGIIDGAIGPLTIEALHQQEVTLEIGSEIVSSLSRLMSFVQGPENALPYEIYGKAAFERGRIDPVDFSAEGLVPLMLPGER